MWGHPYDVTLPDGSTLVPDIVVARREDLGEKEITRPPLLIVEVLSESSRLSDPTVKRAKYEQLGVPAYWIADPIGPTLTVLELAGSTYHTAAVLHGGGSARVQRPFPCALWLPSRL